MKIRETAVAQIQILDIAILPTKYATMSSVD
jgi:hypothetical protein